MPRCRVGHDLFPGESGYRPVTVADLICLVLVPGRDSDMSGPVFAIVCPWRRGSFGDHKSILPQYVLPKI